MDKVGVGPLWPVGRRYAAFCRERIRNSRSDDFIGLTIVNTGRFSVGQSPISIRIAKYTICNSGRVPHGLDVHLPSKILKTRRAVLDRPHHRIHALDSTLGGLPRGVGG